MPFQDEDEVEAIKAPRPPSAVERLLRRIFVEDFGLKLLALAITLFIWFAVTSENTPMSIHTAVQLNLLRPDNLDISNNPPKTVEVVLTGSKHKLNNLKLIDLIATIDLRDSAPGERVIRLSPQVVSLDLPQGLRVDSFQPSTVAVTLEQRTEKQVPVEVRVSGQPAEGYELYRAGPTPTVVRVRGPASHVKGLDKAPTQTISVDGRKESFSISQAAIDITDEKIELLDPLVDVNMEIGPKRTERRLDSVSVRSSSGHDVRPSTAAVTLMGSPDALQKLRPEDVVVIVDPSAGVNSSPHLQLPPAFQQNVTLVSIKPTIFH